MAKKFMLDLTIKSLISDIKSGEITPKRFLTKGLEEIAGAIEKKDVRAIPSYDGKYMDVLHYISQNFGIDTEPYKKAHEILFSKRYDEEIKRRAEVEKEISLRVHKK